MKKLKMATLLLATSLFIGLGNSAKAEVGYFNYEKVIDSYPAAQQAMKDMDAKRLEMQQYMLEKEKQYKNLDTPLKKQNFESQLRSEMTSKDESLARFMSDKENQIVGQIKNAAKAVMVSQKLDAILMDPAVFVGGVDVTELIINKLQN